MTIFQAVLFHNTDSKTLGPAVWAAFREAEAFFKMSNTHRDDDFRRYDLAESATLSVAAADLKAAPRTLTPGFWEMEETRGLYDETYDIGPLVVEARRLIGLEKDGLPLVVVTDVVLSTFPKDFYDRPELPPPTKRYLMWQRVGNSFLISLAPLDPSYWEIKDPNRVQTIKRRFRAGACLCTGTLLGLGVCRTPGCFLYNPVTGVEKLDGLNYLCDKHDGVSDLQGYGFRLEAKEPPVDPAVVQQPVLMETPDR